MSTFAINLLAMYAKGNLKSYMTNIQQTSRSVAVRKLSKILFSKTSYWLKCTNMLDLQWCFFRLHVKVSNAAL